MAASRGPDAEALREVERDYADALRSLTFNNKPQIDALSQIADDHKFAAPIIVRLIEHGLREVVTWPSTHTIDAQPQRCKPRPFDHLTQNAPTRQTEHRRSHDTAVRPSIYADARMRG